MTTDPKHPAFPHCFEPSGHPDWMEGPGLTKFEYFTAAALTGLCANPGHNDIPIHVIGKMAKVYAEAAIGGVDDASFTLAVLEGSTNDKA